MYPDFDFWLQHSHGLLIGQQSSHPVCGGNKQIMQTQHVANLNQGLPTS